MTGGQIASRCLKALGSAGNENEIVTPRSELLRKLLPEASRRTRDQGSAMDVSELVGHAALRYSTQARAMRVEACRSCPARRGATTLRIMLLTRPSGRAILAFAPYGLVSLVHLSALILGASEVGVVTKIMLMPALALALLILLPARRSVVGYLLLSALVLSWGGDFALVIPGELMFLLGLIFFLAAHVVYIVAISSSLRVRRIPFVALAYAGWWIALVALLAPNVGWLVWPLAIYGLVLGGMASVALGSHPAVACGAFLFVVSDTVLALNRFMPSIELPVPDIVIMATYILAQGFIVAGALIVLKRGVPSAWGSPRKERVLNS
ncbi:hypothetical protein DF220_13095 [Salinibacterium hongtaonis]|uniref:Lysoplasmalogenase n=2 Tax=Homoserinimonas hongtaonis TaxID=2079791 RepID=A0A2U1SXC2_9MICO|nr:hypothetical protein DF220_13095 [Salinibacterium hongtaonis]